MSLFHDRPFLASPGNRHSVARPRLGLFALMITGLLAWILLQAAQERPLTPTLASKGIEVRTRPADLPGQLQAQLRPITVTV